MGIAAGMLMIGGCVLLAMDYARSRTELDGIVERNPYGTGTSVRQFEVESEDSRERMPLEMEVREQVYTEAETQAMFRRITNQLEIQILGENESLDRVETDLNLVTEIPEEPAVIAWELDRYDVMNVRGEIQQERIPEEGIPVTLTAVLTYREEESRQARYQCVAMVFPPRLSETEHLQNEIREAAEEAEGTDRQQPTWQLPKKIRGKVLHYYEKMDSRGLVMMGMAATVAGLLWLRTREQMRGEKQKRQEQMRRDYPEIVSKMALFLGAGMTVKRSFRRIVEEYERQKNRTGERDAYEEMKVALREMEAGCTETESYENFGRRCKMPEYLRLASMLSQNLRKGTKGLSHLLKLESVRALEEKKARAKRLGEEAGTKLLLPMFLMLLVVLVIVIVPAFLSLQI